MLQEISGISLSLPYRLGSVNCYLVRADTGFVLVDTGCSNRRKDLDRELEGMGCRPGNLKLVILTHGDFDHTGNAAYLRMKFDTSIALHKDDTGMVERGDMFWNRKKGNFLIRRMAPVLFGFSKSTRFAPDLHIEDGYDFSEYGFDARVLYIPGHSKGSIGVLTGNGDLFCGDLLENTKEPGLNSIMDDSAAANASVEKLRSLEVGTVYPGHGRPFNMRLLFNA